MMPRLGTTLALALAVNGLIGALPALADEGETSIEGAGVGRVAVDPPPDPLAELESLEELERKGRRRRIAGGTLVGFGVLTPMIVIPVALAVTEKRCEYPGES